MTTALPFNPLTVPLQGTNLIEASAGTGKTYGIAALFTRLILLENMSVDSILVVTFTKAATAELKTRLRARLNEALRCLQNDEQALEQADDFMQNLLKKAREQEPEEVWLQMRLKAALSQFDNAAIFTIHGFCQRVLRDYAFLCQAPFDIELNEDSRALAKTAAQDFWRDNVANQALLANLAVKYGLTPDEILQKLMPFLARPALKVCKPSVDLAQMRVREAESWLKLREKIDDLPHIFIKIQPFLHQKIYHLATTLEKFAVLKTWLNHDTPADYAMLSALFINSTGNCIFAPEYLSSKIGKGKQDNIAQADIHALAVLDEMLKISAATAQAEANVIIKLELDLLDEVRNAVAQQKKTRRERGFDDLLLDVYHALTNNPQKNALAQAVANHWQVALIDEFQDTDPLQYTIFRTIFMQHQRPLFLVGDPKQAIYAFRGADIYAYLQAARDAEHHYTLDANFRSHRALVDGIAHLFQQKNQPFVIKDIRYPTVVAAREQCRLTPAPEAAIVIRTLNQASDNRANKDLLRQRAADYCADEIANALNHSQNNQLFYQGKPLEPSAIAVLVRTHNEGQMIQRALKQRKIASVMIQRESVFTSAEAVALATLLGFWLSPQRTEPLRFVLGGVLFRQTASQLAQLNQNEEALTDYINAAAEALETWQQHGIFTAISRFVTRYHIESRLIREQNERALTNFWQLVELLAEHETEYPTPAALHQWLNEQIQTASNKHGEHGESKVLRLESDDSLVKIVTMHASKGLQYPLVYCPFAWDTPPKPDKQGWHILHRADGNSDLLAASQLSKQDEQQLADEELGERLRLLYVALTRAEEMLTIYSAGFDYPTLNPFAYLIEGTADNTCEQILQTYQTAHRADKLTGISTMLNNNWQRLISTAPAGSFSLKHSIPTTATLTARTTPAQPYRAIHLPERRFQFIHHTSFTGLTRTLSHQRLKADDTIQPSLDTAETLAPIKQDVSDGMIHDIYHFPRGAIAGVCLHDILENSNFAQCADADKMPSESLQVIDDGLEKHGFTLEWQTAIAQMLVQVANLPLIEQTSLAQIPKNQIFAEMGFVMQARDFDVCRLKTWFNNSDLPDSCKNAANQLDFGIINGFLNGFIDLTVIIDGKMGVIDYKSNHLGNSAEDYQIDALNQAVAEHHYYFQAFIYAIAIARYCRHRQIAVDTIHIRYLFLRGLSVAKQGVWQWDIAIEDLKEWL